MAQGVQMITVRFPSGVSLTYNTATYIERTNDHVDICYRDANQKGWKLAEVPKDCVIEYTAACKIENPTTGLTSESAIRLLLQSDAMLRSAPLYLLGQLKAKLADFNRKTYAWKD